MERGFRYQTGEIDKVVQALADDSCTEMDIDQVEELDEIFEDLAAYDIHLNQEVPYDYSAVDTVEQPEFYARITFILPTGRDAYIDFYHVDQEEEDYDEIFWG